MFSILIWQSPTSLLLNPQAIRLRALTSEPQKHPKPVFNGEKILTVQDHETFF